MRNTRISKYRNYVMLTEHDQARTAAIRDILYRVDFATDCQILDSVHRIARGEAKHLPPINADIAVLCNVGVFSGCRVQRVYLCTVPNM